MKNIKFFWKQLILISIIIALIVILLFPFITLLNIKTLGESIKPLIEIIVIIVGGLWSYRLFVKNRLDYPVAEITQEISHYDFDTNFRYINVFVTMKNISKVLIELDYCQILVQHMFPIHSDILDLIKQSDTVQLREGLTPELFSPRDKQITWREIGYREYEWGKGIINLDPGQKDTFQYEFIISKEVQTIRVISYFHNQKITHVDVGWRTPTVYSFEKEEK